MFQRGQRYETDMNRREKIHFDGAHGRRDPARRDGEGTSSTNNTKRLLTAPTAIASG